MVIEITAYCNRQKSGYTFFPYLTLWILLHLGFYQWKIKFHHLCFPHLPYNKRCRISIKKLGAYTEGLQSTPSLSPNIWLKNCNNFRNISLCFILKKEIKVSWSNKSMKFFLKSSFCSIKCPFTTYSITLLILSVSIKL